MLQQTTDYRILKIIRFDKLIADVSKLIHTFWSYPAKITRYLNKDYFCTSRKICTTRFPQNVAINTFPAESPIVGNPWSSHLTLKQCYNYGPILTLNQDPLIGDRSRVNDIERWSDGAIWGRGGDDVNLVFSRDRSLFRSKQPNSINAV